MPLRTEDADQDAVHIYMTILLSIILYGIDYLDYMTISLYYDYMVRTLSIYMYMTIL